MPVDQRVDVGGVTLVVRVWAAQESSHSSVVLLPATAETAEDWDVVASSLSVARRVFAVNLRGHGPSDWPGTYSIQLLADDVARLLNGGFAGRPVDLVGHSLGGLVACSVAAACPELDAGSCLRTSGCFNLAQPLLRPNPKAFSRSTGVWSNRCAQKLTTSTRAGRTWSQRSTPPRSSWLVARPAPSRRSRSPS